LMFMVSINPTITIAIPPANIFLFTRTIFEIN
jgi:hypothetical protein